MTIPLIFLRTLGWICLMALVSQKIICTLQVVERNNTVVKIVNSKLFSEFWHAGY